MRWSLRALYELGREQLPLGTSPPPEVDRLSDFDAPIFSLGCFEYRLAPGSREVDFSACVEMEGEVRADLHERIARLSNDGLWPAGEGWARCLALLRDWSCAESPLFRASNCVWLEFDLGNGGGETQPFGIVRLRPGGELTSDPALHPLRTSRRAAELLLGRRLSREASETLERCHRSLPPSGRFLHVAAMPLRDRSPIRLIVSIPISAIPGYVERIGWSADRDGFELLGRAVSRLEPFPTRMSLHLDIESGVGPQLGLDMYRGGSPLDDPPWKVLFDWLDAEAACSEERCRAISSWPHREHQARSPFGFDRQLATKAVLSPGERVRAKAYLAFGPRLGRGGPSP